MQTRPPGNHEPTPTDLAEIEREWPLIEAEMTLLDAEIICMTAGDRVSVLDRHRLRRAEARVLRELVKFRATGNTHRAVAA